MTIAIGILCSDGIILCADTQESLDEYSKISRPKVFELSAFSEDIKAVLAGSGDSVFIDALRGKLESALDLADLTCDSLCEKIEQALVSYYSTIWPLYATQRDRPTADLIIGMRAPDGFVLLHADGPIVRRVSSFESVGFGSVFSTYHLDKLFQPTMDLETACPVAVHVLDVVKANVEFCGGETQALVIPKDGEVERLSETYIKEKSEAFRSLSATVDALLARAASLRYAEDQFLSKLVRVYDLVPAGVEKAPAEALEAMIAGGMKAVDQIDAFIEAVFYSMVKKEGLAKVVGDLVHVGQGKISKEEFEGMIKKAYMESQGESGSVTPS